MAAIVYTGASKIFVEVDPMSLTIDGNRIEEVIKFSPMASLLIWIPIMEIVRPRQRAF